MLIGGLGIATFGATLPVTRVVVSHSSGTFVGLGRAVFGALFAIAVLAIVRPGFPSRAQLLRLAVVAGGVVVGFPVLASIAMGHVPASHGAVVLGVLPLATAVVGSLISHERPSLGFWVCGGLGSLVVVVFALHEGGGSFGAGDVALVGAIAAAAVGYAVGARLAVELGGWQVISWALVLALPFSIVPMLQHVPDGWRDAPASAWLGFLYLCAVSQYLGFFLWYKGLALGGIARVSQVQLLQPFVTFAVAAMFFGERLTAGALLALIGVSVAVAVGRRMPIRSTVLAEQE